MKFRDWLINEFESSEGRVQLLDDLNTLEDIEVLVGELFDEEVKSELLFQVKLARESIEDREVDVE